MKIFFAIAFFLLMVPFPVVFCSDIIQLAQSNHADATAYSNGRRIARTSYDRRFVVYQDSVDNQPAVMWLYSDDGVTWSAPALLAYGSFPSLTIAENDDIYVVWVLEGGGGIGVTFMEDSTLTWETGLLPRKIIPDDALYCKYPVVEITNTAVHIVWQGKIKNHFTDGIFYQRFNRALSDTLALTMISGSNAYQSEFPTIVGDLEFYGERAHIFWSDLRPLQNQSRIMYCGVNAATGTLTRPLGTPFLNNTHPSTSVRNGSGDDSYCRIILSCANRENNGFLTCFLWTEPDTVTSETTEEIPTRQNPLPTVDDVYMASCAILWQDNNTIYYGQNIDGFFVTLPPIPVSDTNAVCKNPNVCYKTFRQDVFDVVWTQGDTPPYQIMYRRMEKRFSPLSVYERPLQTPLVCQLLQNYPNPFNSKTQIRYSIASDEMVSVKIFDIQGKLVQMLVNEKQPAGSHTVYWDGTTIHGNPVCSGLYYYVLRAGKEKRVGKMALLK